jgi:hypothetical protein
MLNLSRFVLSSSVVILAGAYFATPISAAEQWVKVLTNNRGDWFVDKGSITIKGQDRTFWSYIAHKSPSKIRNLTVQTSGNYVAVDCRTRQYRLLYQRLMDKNNKLVSEIDLSNRSTVEAPDKGSGEEHSIKFACAQK